MNDRDDEELIRRLDRLGNVKPAPEATRHALERVRQALLEQPARNLPSWRKIMLKRFAAAAVILLGAGTLFAWLLPAPAPARAAFAEVQAAMKASGSVTCTQVTRVKGKPAETIHLFILGNGRWRVEEADGSYTVTDTRTYRVLLVKKKERKATLLQGVNVPPVNLYEFIKNLPADASARAVPGKKIDGKAVLGFVVKVQGHDLTVWADAKTRLPVRIEADEKDDQGMTTGEVIIHEFVFDKALDAQRFTLEPPAGYQFETKGVAELPAAPADAKLKDLVATPVVGIGPVKFGMARAEVEKLLGKPDGVQAVGQGGYVDLNYGSRGFFLGVSQKLGVVTITCVAQKTMLTRVRDFSGKTDQGIALGASMADIIRAYGPPDSKETNQGSTYLSYNPLQAHFTLFDDKLVQIQLYRKRPAK